MKKVKSMHIGSVFVVCVVVGVAAFFLLGCSGADLLNLTIPSRDYTLHKDVAYGDDARMTMDVYVPRASAPSRCAVVFIYGGSWQTGSKDIYKFAGEAFASMGCVAFIPDYRLYPAVKYPDFLDDTAQAYVFAQKHAADYGANAGHMVIAGHSAGAYNAMMLVLRPELLSKAGGDVSSVKGMIGIAGPYDFLPFTDDKIIDIFSTEKDVLTQPIHYVRKGLPPMLLAHGDDDDEVGLKNTVNMTVKLKETNNRVETHIYKAIGHVGIVVSLAHGFRGRTALYSDVKSFIDSLFRQP